MSNIYGGDEVNALVLEVGSCTCRAGYAGDDAPKAVFPSHVGVTQGSKESSGMEVDGAPAPASSRQLHVGQAAVNIRRDNMEVMSPFNMLDDGVADWDALEAVWEHALKERLRADTKEYAILMAEPNGLPKAARERMVEMLFQKFQVPALFLAKNAALSAFSTARQTALVLDAGYRATSVTAVHDGYVLNKSITTNPIGGKLLNTLMQRSLEHRAVRMVPRYGFKRVEVSPGEYKAEHLSFPNTTSSFHQFQVEALISDLRETLCKVNDTPFDEQVHSHLPPAVYELPDGTEIAVGSDRLKVPEVFFQPHLASTFQGFNPDSLKRADGSTVALQSLPASILESVNKCDVDVKRELYQGVVLTGGLSSTPGLRERLEKDLVEQGPQAGRFKIVMPANIMERKFSAWIGGSILASLGSFQQMWMSRKEYDEYGASLIHKKAP